MRKAIVDASVSVNVGRGIFIFNCDAEILGILDELICSEKGTLSIGPKVPTKTNV
jgi:hypothetical protein